MNKTIPAGFKEVPDLQGYMPKGETLIRDNDNNAYVLEADGVSIHDLPCGLPNHKHQSKITADGWFYCPEEG